MKTEFSGTRQPAVADQFYPAESDHLRKQVDTCFGNAAIKKTDPSLRALIVPHAGYVYSGATAAAGYARLKGRQDIKRVVVVTPSHRAAFHGLSTGSYSHFKTPLGEIPVDTESCARLLTQSRLFNADNQAHAAEHSLEVQLPFLQRALGEFSLIPLSCGALDVREARAAARILADVLWKRDTLWVISSDFTHFGRAFDYMPFKTEIKDGLEALDAGALHKIINQDLDGFAGYIDETGATICGRMPIMLLLGTLEAVDEKNRCEVLAYTTSGHLTGDFQHSVSYACVGIFAAAAQQCETSGKGDGQLADAEKKTLLKLARETLAGTLAGKKAPLPPENELSERLREAGASFVSLHLNGRLRGCIGSILPTESLYLNVIDNARNAAFRDPRFTPLTEAELKQVDIEISVLTQPRDIESWKDFEVGRHGVILAKRGRRAVFLPQVASEQGWDAATTLSHLAVKAGLGPDDWKQGATLQVFEAIVFGE